MTSNQIIKFSGATKSQMQYAIDNLNYPKVGKGSNRIFTPKMVYETCNWLALHYHLNIYQTYPSNIND